MGKYHTIYFEIELIDFFIFPAFHLHQFDLALHRLLYETAFRIAGAGIISIF